MRTIICSKYPDLVQWLKARHPELYGSVWLGGEALMVDEVTPEMARGNRIIGDLARELRPQCPEYWCVIASPKLEPCKGDEYALSRWKPT